MRIALDAMAGDHGPEPLVRGAIAAVEETCYQIILVGDAEQIETILHREHAMHPRLSVVHADTVIGMDESPKASLKKKTSSLAVSAELVRNADADAVVSAGNTGATHMTVVLRWRPLEGVSRPSLATVLPVPHHPVVLLDVGANIDCKPRQLCDFGIMGSIYAREIFGWRSPRVGLLNIGEEKGKGTEVVNATYDLLSQADINFSGNVEGGDMFKGCVDVVVCDGFVGNAILKFGEGLLSSFTAYLKDELTLGNPITQLGALMVRPAMKRCKARLDVNEYGGAPLLGVNGTCIVSHGSSDEVAIKNAIRMAGDCVNRDINGKIMQALNPSAGMVIDATGQQ
jgi:glycerol-3-phosphate acyltransferase PlsX